MKEEKKEVWEIGEILQALRKLGMEIFSIQGARSEVEKYERKMSWCVFFYKEKSPPLTK